MNHIIGFYTRNLSGNHRPKMTAGWRSLSKILPGLFCLGAAGPLLVQGSTMDAIGITLLNSQTAGLNGAGVRVAQVEADSPSPGDFNVNPQVVGQPVNLFSYYSIYGVTLVFPNVDGAQSGHADQVAQNFYGMATGVATNVAHVDNYEQGDFVTIGGLGTLGLGSFIVYLPGPLNDPVINQSFVIACSTTNKQTALDAAYDTYAANNNTLFVSAAGDGGPVAAPSTSYNGLSVGAIGGYSSTGPTLDNGRAKPDLVAPAGATSFSAPLVAGAAATLIQAGLRGDGGPDTNAATSICTLKALLLNGAIKPPGWRNASPSPLDANLGAGVLNVFNSYHQLTGGKQSYTTADTVAAGAAHPPLPMTGSVSVLSGWDFNTNTSGLTDDGINHYYFNVTNNLPGATFTTTATLVWNRQRNQTNINNLSLFLYNADNGALVMASTSTVDNVQHVWVPQLPAGHYDLQVWKAGGTNIVSTTESYALAFEFFSLPLSINRAAGATTLSWPVYPAGFMLATATDPTLPVNLWNTNYPAPTVSQSLNQMTVAAPNAAEFFQLVRP